MKTQQINTNQMVNFKSILGKVTNPFAEPKVNKIADIPDANLRFLKQMHINF